MMKPTSYLLFQYMEQFSPVTFALAAMMGVDATYDAVQNDADSIAEDIKKFEELRDGGIITEEEYLAKKNQY